MRVAADPEFCAAPVDKLGVCSADEQGWSEKQEVVWQLGWVQNWFELQLPQQELLLRQEAVAC